MIRTVITYMEGKLGSILRYIYYGCWMRKNNAYFASMSGFYMEGTKKIEIGKRCSFNRGVYITASEDITIGDDVIIGAYTVIRDADHGMDNGTVIKDQQLTTAPIKIGNGVWIGAHCVILKGSVIGDGAVLGANSLIKGNMPPGEIWVGSPARKLRRR